MNHPSEADSQVVERIMRRAEAMGLDPERVGRALDHKAPQPTEYQATEDMEPRSRFRRSVAARFARTSR
jgi:hypothetical protein